MISNFSSVSIAILVLHLFFYALLRFTHDSKEPPAVETLIPFISPLISLGRGGYRYWSSKNGHLPMYTLRLPFMRLYVVNFTAMIPVVQKQVRTISFSPIMARMTSTAMGLSKGAVEVISKDPVDENGFIMGTTRPLRPLLSPGPNLDGMNRRSVQLLASSLNKLAAEGPKTLQMSRWISHEVMMATTEGVYGPHNPFRDPEIREAFRRYEVGFVPLMMDVLPTLTARDATHAREFLVKAYEKYYVEDMYNHPDASIFIKERYRLFHDRDISDADIARLEVTTSIALISNTMPATFWLVLHLFSDPELLERCRQELSSAVQENDDTCIVDMSCVKSYCPVLLSTLQEVLRFYGIGVSTRMVLEGTTVGNYLLKKGAIVLIPAAAQHNAPAWGENADEFQARRFLQVPGKKGRQYDPVAFRGFGGGATLCPGRHFAATEMLAFASCIILRFDAQPLGGRWILPTTENSNMGVTIRQPDYDLQVTLRPRTTRDFIVTFSESDKAMKVSAEDIMVDDEPKTS